MNANSNSPPPHFREEGWARPGHMHTHLHTHTHTHNTHMHTYLAELPKPGLVTLSNTAAAIRTNKQLVNSHETSSTPRLAH